jgi:ABC-type Zn uptake system ZnuABC Zn-binding protein ZnuA
VSSFSRRFKGSRVGARLALAALAVLATLAVLSPSRASGQASITVVATLPMFADMARQVAGSRAEVVSLLGIGVDPHSYQMTPPDLATLNRGQVFVYNGVGLEPFVASMLAGADRAGLIRVELAEGLTPVMQSGQANPHFWLNPQFTIRYVERIRDGLSQADAAGAGDYAANADRYIGELRALDAEIENQLSQIPSQNRKLVVSHDAFTYFARRYGFEEIASVLSTEAREPSPNQLVALIRQVRQAGAHTIFVEPQVTSRLIEQIAREASLQIVPIYSDSFPADGSITTYMDMMRADARFVVDGLR